jgi:surface carbohydrate biosynthesis protein (TIGR04326 family)
MTSVLVCEKKSDAQTVPEINFSKIFLWSSFDGEKEQFVSLPSVVDQDFEKIRREYLRWLSGLARSPFRKKNFIECFEIRKNFSIWWMSLLVEKSQWKSDSMYKVFRFLVLDNLLRKMVQAGLTKVVVDLPDHQVCSALETWCRFNHIKFILVPRNLTRRLPNSPYIFTVLSHSIKGFSYLIYAITIRLLPALTHHSGYSNNRPHQISFISYFFNLDREELERGRYVCRYWAGLSAESFCNLYSRNWLHLFVKGNDVTGLRGAARHVRRLNVTQSRDGYHQLLDCRIGYREAIRIVRDYTKTWRAALSLMCPRQKFRVRDGRVDLWPLLSGDWMSSFFGKIGASNAIYLNIFEATFKKMPHQRKGFYLLENQAWERALIHAWRSGGHGSLVGVVHSVVSPCDLRHFFDRSEYEESSFNALPLPDFVAVNGEVAKSHYLNAGFPTRKLIQLEALRYNYLSEFKISKPVTRIDANRLRLLVLGDYIPSTTRQQMVLLSQAAARLSDRLDILVKAHPACEIHSTDWPLLNLTKTEETIDRLVHSYDVAFTSNTTGAAVDAYLAGKVVVSVIDATTFNMSPLRGLPDVQFVSTPDELVLQLDLLRSQFSNGWRSRLVKEVNFFYTDPKLPRWHRILRHADYECQ